MTILGKMERAIPRVKRLRAKGRSYRTIAKTVGVSDRACQVIATDAWTSTYMALPELRTRQGINRYWAARGF
jgi:hypothetical protein